VCRGLPTGQQFVADGAQPALDGGAGRIERHRERKSAADVAKASRQIETDRAGDGDRQSQGPLGDEAAHRIGLVDGESEHSPPTGGVLTRASLQRLADIAVKHNLWVISDEAYEDVVFDGEHVSIASLPDMYRRTIPLYTFSKSYAMTGLRLGYIAIANQMIRDRAKKILFYTASNVASVVQYGGVGALEGSQHCIETFRTELRARRDLFYRGVKKFAGGVFTGEPPAGAFYAFLKIDPSWADPSTGGSTTGSGQAVAGDSVSWRMVEYLIAKGRIGCVPGVDFGPNGEGYVRFCFARDRKELTGALQSMKELFGVRV